jgi:transposase
MAGSVREILSLDWDALRALGERADAGRLRDGDLALVSYLVRTVFEFAALLSRRDATLSRLRRLLFGPRSERRGLAADAPAGAAAEQAARGAEQTPEVAATAAADGLDPPAGEKAKRTGHGRKPASVYTGAAVVTCTHPHLRPGEACPDHPCPGTLYDTRTPNRFIQFTGQPPVAATRFDQAVLRCSACQFRYEAPLPEGVAPERWDPSADVSIVMARYAAGLPFYRLAKLQAAFGVPLSQGTLWDRVLSVAEAARPVAEHLAALAARADLIHCDDTPVRILTLMAENKRRREEGGGTPNKGERVAMQTTAMLALTGGHWIVLYRSGREHAGENVGKLLEARPEGLDPPVQMADALPANFSHGKRVEKAKCLAHARRNFVEVESSFPQACTHVLDRIAAVYRVEAETRAKAMTPAERLAHHALHSAPLLEQLRVWIREQFELRLVEPSSSLGDALAYMLDHFDELVKFTSVAGAPIDNTPVERVLKLVVLSRKNSLFFKNENGARVGDRLAGLLQTCSLAGVAAYDYLLALARNADAVRAAPAEWLPWTYPRHGATAKAA